MGPKLLAWRGNDKKLSKKQVKQVSKIVNKSKKYKMSYGCFTNNFGITQNLWTDLISQAGSQGLEGIIEGTESFERQGDTIMLSHYDMTVSLQILYDITVSAPATTPNPFANFRIVVTRLFGVYSGNAIDYFSGGSRTAQFIVEKGTVLFDKTLSLSASPSLKDIKFKIPCKNKKIPHILIQYNDADPVGVEKNDIRVFVFATSANSYVNYAESIGYYDKY